MSDVDRLALAERLEQTLRVMQGARRSNSKTMSVWPDDTKNVEDALFALRADRRDEAVAFVPLHPRNGPLWSDTYPTGSEWGRSTNYERMPLYAHPAASQGEVREERCARCGSVGDTYVLCAGCNSPVRSAAQPMREKIAQIIDANAFTDPKHPVLDDGFWRGQGRQSALSKADAILKLTPASANEGKDVTLSSPPPQLTGERKL